MVVKPLWGKDFVYSPGSRFFLMRSRNIKNLRYHQSEHRLEHSCSKPNAFETDDRSP
jgi:hypothetical protein